ncbi:MAG: DUF1648 domain-containing protein [Candidatus Pacebacteria bacterium]|nr:DUF1648 domain-containing protein [Candidatus Paceibacterota bacterium]
MKKIEIFILLIILLAFAAGFYLYPQMPEKMASHWNAKGDVDGYMPKAWALFLMPVLSTVLYLMFRLIPGIDPLKENIEKFREYFDWFVVLVICFLFYIYALTIFWSFGYRFDMGQVLSPALGILFYYAGILTANAKKNWFIGIRTPWTMSYENVWNKTNRLGGKMFKISGVICLFGIVFPAYAFWFVIVPVFFTTVYTIIYSYFAYKMEKR